ncbi:hypothetical protein EML15_08780 [Corynebacterium sp. sy017]|uniref:hypothetical protein n=1 Tax=unclassified Corynebacterium TaxID=2624378 RepID=UPI001184E8B0|nr:MULTISPECIES: hypothetical protein [unclassified Corynebacterium]MBP3089238.1 hypothetical protein [Corynebacterium sp. sy017]TSD91055.1 hypothetical protein ELY17_09820 [Corynebacterium sp. SY003]
MMGIYAIINAVRVLARSSNATFASVRTFIVTVFCVPALGISLDVLLGNGVGAPELVPIVVASLVISSFSLAAAIVVGIVVHDRNTGIALEIFSRRRIPLAYWCGASILACATSVLGSVVVLAVLTLTAGVSWSLLFQLVVPSALCGVGFGMCAAGVGLLRANPYVLLNWVVALLPLSSGVVVPLEFYPPPAAALLRMLPLTQVVQAWRGGRVPTYHDNFATLLSCALLAVLGCLIAQRFSARMRKGVLLQT